MAEETMGQREVGIDVAVPSVPVVGRMMARGIVRDSVRLVRDGDFSWRRKLYYLVVGPLYHLQKWRGVRRGAMAPVPARTTTSDHLAREGSAA
jgi:rhamnosyltransferase